jgi:cytoskeleton protein RodZ
MAILLPDRIDLATFGEFLRDARERRGLTLQEIARETRIPFRHLDALEHGHLDEVPSGMYRRAEIRAYADAVGLDRSLALAQLEHALESSVAQQTTKPSATPRPDRARAAWMALGAIGVVAAATLFAVSLWNDQSRPVAADAPRVSAVPSAPPGAPVDVAQPEPMSIVEAPAMRPPGPAEPVITTPISTALTLTSDPSGARVVVDGIGRGTTPVTVENLTSGVRRVRVIKDGFVSVERDVRVGTGREPATLHVTLDTVH